ncbi:MAG: thioredoxin domain-containing protein, partial [Deltaproteobacteria bacterium]|nr:thioredoxin domain-containing protein [Deltaproteobacteria bacterium]
AMLDMFWDEQNGGLYFSGKENESLIIKTKDLYDGAIPSGNAVAALNLLRLSRMTGNVGLEKKAEQLIGAASGTVRTYPAGYTQLLGAIDFLIGPSQEIVIAGDPALPDTREMIKTVQRSFFPTRYCYFILPGPMRADSWSWSLF